MISSRFCQSWFNGFLILLLTGLAASSCLALAADPAALPVAEFGNKPRLEPGGYLVQLIGGLAFVVLMILALAWVMRRFSGAAGFAQPRAIEILAVRSISARERIILLQIGEEQILIGASPAGIRTLHHLKNPLILENDSKAGVDFASLLRKQISKSTEP